MDAGSADETWACTMLYDGVDNAKRMIASSLAGRMMRSGLDPRLLSRRSGIPLADVKEAINNGSASVDTFSRLTLAMRLFLDRMIEVPLLDKKQTQEVTRRMKDERAGFRRGTGTPGQVLPSRQVELRTYLLLRVLHEIASTRNDSAETGEA
jgi:hypothetical protein